MKKIISLLLSILMLTGITGSISLSAMASENEGWYKKDGSLHYYGDLPYAKGEYYGAAYTIDNEVYIFDKDGALITDKGWQSTFNETEEHILYSHPDDERVMQEIIKHIYYVGKGGKCVRGWQKIGGKWFWFDDDCKMATGSRKINGKLYCFNEDGALSTKEGWIKTTYYFYRDEDIESAECWFYTDKRGICYTGWQKIGGKWYWFADKDNIELKSGPETDIEYSIGQMVTGVQQINDKVYLFDESGAWLGKSGWYADEREYATDWYYINSNGTCTVGWQKIGGKWYWFDEYGVMKTGQQNIRGKNYFFKTSGALADKAGWQSIKNDTETSWYYTDKNGICYTGWQKIGGKWYWFSTDDENWRSIGKMVTANQTFNNKTYLFDENGALIEKAGWHKAKGLWFCTDKNGVCFIGWKKLGGKWYYFDPENYYYSERGAMITGTEYIDGKEYTFDKNGVWIA